MIKRRVLAAMLLGSAGLWSVPALAVITCSVSANGVAFGAYDPLSGDDRDSTGSVTVECTRLPLGSLTVNYEVRLNAGNRGSFTPRAMSAGADTLEYNLYTDPTRTTTWGDGSSGTVSQSGSLSWGLGGLYGTKTQSFTTYGRIFGAQFVPAGTYSDTITVTVLY